MRMEISCRFHERYRYAASDDQPEYATAVIQCDHDCQCLCQHDHPEYTMTLVSLVMIAIMLFTTKKVAGLSGRYFLAQQKSLGAVNGYIEEMMEGQKVVKVFCHEEESLEKFNQLNDELYDQCQQCEQIR